MNIRFSNGVLESLLCAVMLRKLYGQNRARDVQEQSHVRSDNERNVGTYRTERR